jgi:hypothetical protein
MEAAAVNELLLWMSARASGSLRSFRARCAELDMAEFGQTRGAPPHRRAAWALSKLGHAEFTETGWRIAPPVLAADGIGSPARAVMCGARPLGVLERLAHFADDGQISMAVQAGGPDVIDLRAVSTSALAAIARTAGLQIQWNAPLAILAAGTPVSQIALSPLPIPVGGGWAVSRFSKSALNWVPSTAAELKDAKRALFRFRGEYSTMHVLKENGETWSCDAAAGKFRALTRRQRPLGYRVATQELAIAATCRPPALVERALVLASGRLPELRDGSLIYPGVAAAAANAAAAILGQRLY